MKVRSLIEARTEAQNILLSGDKFLSQNQLILTKSEKSRTSELLKTVKESMEGEDKDAIQMAMDNLNQFTKPLAKKAIDMTIAKALKGTELK